MTVSIARPAARRAAGLGLGIAGLGLFAALSGIGVALGEFEAMVAVLTIIAGCAVLADFRVGAVLFILMMPIERSVFFPHSVFGQTGLNPLNLLLAATLASFLLRGQNVGRLVPKPLWWLVLLPILVAGVLGSRHVDEIFPEFYEALLIKFTDAFGYLRDVAFKPLLMVVGVLLVGAALARSQKPERFVTAVIVSIWISSLMSIVFVAWSGVSLGLLATSGAREFFGGVGVHANDLGRMYASAYGLLLFTWGETKDLRLKSVLVATMGVVTLGLLFTFSRGAFIGFAVINALYFLWKLNAKTVALALGVMALAVWLMPGAVIGRMSMGLVGGADVNEFSAGRVDEIWLPLLPELLRSPPWGNGLDATMWSHAIWSEAMLVVTHPHNAYLQTILDMGVIGLGLLLAYYWHVYRRLQDLGSNPNLSATMRGFFQGTVAALACFLITGFSGSTLRPTPEFAFMWIAIGMMYGQLARRPTA